MFTEVPLEVSGFTLVILVPAATNFTLVSRQLIAIESPSFDQAANFTPLFSLAVLQTYL